jgi:hypothetical protein
VEIDVVPVRSNSGAAIVNYFKIKSVTKIDRASCGRLERLDMYFISLSLLAREV